MKQLSTQSLSTLDDMVSVNTKIKTDIGLMYKQTEDTNMSVQEISTVANFINEISTQTNLLALNASIEAARAGEYGKGFSVVAKEIGTLAEQSTKAVENIGKSIEALLTKSNHSMETMKQMDSSIEEQVNTLENTKRVFNELYQNIDQCIDSVDRIKVMTDEIQNHSAGIHDTIIVLNELAQGNAANAEETLGLTEEIESHVGSVSNNMSQISESLEDLMKQIRKFRID